MKIGNREQALGNSRKVKLVVCALCAGRITPHMATNADIKTTRTADFLIMAAP